MISENFWIKWNFKLTVFELNMSHSKLYKNANIVNLVHYGKTRLKWKQQNVLSCIFMYRNKFCEHNSKSFVKFFLFMYTLSKIFSNLPALFARPSHRTFQRVSLLFLVRPTVR